MRGLPTVFWYLWVGALVNRLGGAMFMFLALYLTSTRGFSVALAGMTVSLYGAGSLCAGPLGGLLADHIGRRATMLISFAASAAAMLQFSLAVEPAHILISIALLGFVSDIYRPALQAAVADLVPPADRTRAYGYLYWAANLGFAGAGILGGLAARGGFQMIFVVNAASTLLFGIIVYLRVPDTRPPHEGARELLRDLVAPYRDRVFVRFVCVQFLVLLVFHQGTVALPLDMKAHGISPAMFGAIIATNGIAIVVLQPLAIAVNHLVSRIALLAAGGALVGLGFGATALVATPSGYVLSIVVWTLGEIAFSIVTPTLVASMAPAALRGGYQGGMQLAWGVASAIGPVAGSAVYAGLGGRTLWAGCAAMGLLAGVLHLAMPRGR